MAGILTPGGPLVSFPIMAVFYKGGASLSALVAYMTSWSLFGFQRVLAWELPFMGTRFLLARVLPTLVFPIVAGYLVRFSRLACRAPDSAHSPGRPAAGATRGAW